MEPLELKTSKCLDAARKTFLKSFSSFQQISAKKDFFLTIKVSNKLPLQKFRLGKPILNTHLFAPELTVHPSYSPDLTPNNFILFPNVLNQLCGLGNDFRGQNKQKQGFDKWFEGRQKYMAGCSIRLTV